MGKISLIELAAVLSKKYGLNKKVATRFVSKMFDIIQKSLEQDKTVKIKGLGTFKIIDVDARESVNVNTGERVLIEGHNKITFTPDTMMKELVNKPFSQFETVVLNDGVDFEDAVASESLVSDSDEEPLTESSRVMPLVEFSDHSEKETPERVIEPGKTEAKAMQKSEPEPGPVVERESKPEPKPEPIKIIPEPEKTTEPELPADEAEGEPTEEPGAKEEEAIVVASEKETFSGNKWLLPLVTLLIGLAGGYLLGNHYPFSSQPAQQDVVVLDEPIKMSENNPIVVEPKDSVVVESKDSVVTDEPKVEDVKVDAPKSEAAKVEDPQPAKPAEKTGGLDKYQQKDARVRTGAWLIVGTAQVVKANQGETLARISRRYLGPDMECYVEVYNDLPAYTPLKAGQEIKIPKLKYRKLKKK